MFTFPVTHNWWVFQKCFWFDPSNYHLEIFSGNVRNLQNVKSNNHHFSLTFCFFRQLFFIFFLTFGKKLHFSKAPEPQPVRVSKSIIFSHFFAKLIDPVFKNVFSITWVWLSKGTWIQWKISAWGNGGWRLAAGSDFFPSDYSFETSFSMAGAR